MKDKKNRPVPLHPKAQEIMLLGVRLVLVLLFCQVLLLWLGGPLHIDTYYRFQNLQAMEETVAAVLVCSLMGTFWLQRLYSAEK